MKHTNMHGIKSKSVIDALVHDDYDLTERPENVFSATQIIDAPKPKVLFYRHREEIIVDVSDNFHMLDGSAVHYAVERSNKNAEAARLSEERIFIEVNGLEELWHVHTLKIGEKIVTAPWYSPQKLYVSCKFDNYEYDDQIVEDYKRCSVWETIYGLKESRVQQLNIAALGLDMLGFPVVGCRACLFLKDWTNGDLRSFEAKGDLKYPKVAYKEYQFTRWDEKKTREYIFERVHLHFFAQQVDDDEIPPCTQEERWYRGESYAVMKDGVKTAKRVFKVEPGTTTAEEAEKFANSHAEELQSVAKKGEHFYVEKRPGQDIRCNGDKVYCPSRTFCHYWRQKYGNVDNSEY